MTEICTDTIKPSIRPAIFRREIEEGKPFLLVEVPQGYALHDSPGGGYHRVGSSKRKMTSDERLRLAQKRGQTRFLWFDKQPVPETGFGSLDESLWKPLLSAEGATTPELALEKMGLLIKDEKRHNTRYCSWVAVVHPFPRGMASQRLHLRDLLPWH